MVGTTETRIFVDELPRSVAAGTSVGDAVAAGDPELAEQLRAGRAYVTDGVGRPITITETVFPGAIYRVVHSARREGETPGAGSPQDDEKRDT